MIAGAAIPDDLRRFILTSVPSVPYIEAILLLRRAPRQAWTAAQVARDLYLPEAQAGQLLAGLEAAGIAHPDGSDPPGFRYEPRPELAAMLDRVAQAYAGNLVAVTDLIHSGVGKRAYQFADAFRWRKEP